MPPRPLDRASRGTFASPSRTGPQQLPCAWLGASLTPQRTGRRRAASAARSRQPSPLHTSVFLRPAKKILPEYQYQDRRKCNMKTYTRKYESSDNVCIHIYNVLTCSHPQIEHDLIYCPLFGGVRTVHCQRGCLCPNTNTEHVVRQATWENVRCFSLQWRRPSCGGFHSVEILGPLFCKP